MHELCAQYAARLREELCKRELRMQPLVLDMWNVMKTLQPLRVNPPKEYKALFESQRACKSFVQSPPAIAVYTIGCVVLDDAPDSVLRHFDIMAMESLLECLHGGRGHLRLQGLTHVQGGCMVLEPFANVLHFSEPLRSLERSCFEHCMHLLEDVTGIKVRIIFVT